MDRYTTSTGYEVSERMNGLDIYDENGDYICELHGRTLDEYRDEEEVIDEDALEDDIKNQLEVEEFIDYQSGYC